jgi:Zn-dependent protease
MSGNINLPTLIVMVISILISLVIHEFMHAYVGYKLGDSTAKTEGRLSLNPLSHIDPFMTIILPIITIKLFGAPILAAKPVPFDPRNVKYDEFGAAMIAAAGPLSNLALAIVVAFVDKLVGMTHPGVQSVLGIFIVINVALFVFNLLPIPPLDGSRVLYAFAPEPLQRFMMQIEPIGLFIIFGLVLAGGLGGTLQHLNSLVLNLLP